MLITDVSVLLQQKPATTGTLIGSGDWQLCVERLVGNASGGVWDLDTWSVDGAPDVAGEWATLQWVSVTTAVRGMEWTRGADQPNGRPINGEIVVTINNDTSGIFDPWATYANTRPGTVLRAGLISATDVRAGGWLPLWTGVVESWTPQYEGARSIGYRADSFAEVRLVETLSWVARVDGNAVSVVGAGDAAQTRVDRLLTAAEWPYGMVTLYGAGGASAIALQSTTMAVNRLTELYLTADSSKTVVMSDVTGACLLTDRTTTKQSRLYQFSSSAGSPMLTLYATDAVSGGVISVGYEPDSFTTANDPEGIVNDHRYTRVGGTQQLLPHAISIGAFGRSTRARSDLIMTTDGNALVVARDDNDREARTALRVDAVQVVTTGRSLALLAVAAADWSDGVTVYPPGQLSTFTGFGTGSIRSLTHQVTPLSSGGVHWTATFACDFSAFTNVTGAILPVAP